MRVASIATYSDRLDVLPDAVRSLASQVDVVVVYYNSDTSNAIKWREWLKIENEIYHQCDVENLKVYPVDDQADLSKFRAIWYYPNATIFTCDDDLIYAPDYVYKMTQCLYNDHMIGADVVTLGGKEFGDVKVEGKKRFRDLFRNRSSCFGINLNWVYTPEYDVPLSGVSAFNAKHFQDCKIDEKYMYAADLQLAKWCQDKGLSIKSAWNRPKALVKYNKKMKGKETIWDNHTSQSDRIVELAKEIWRSQK